MPSAETLERFIARVESNAHVEAIAEFYAPEASMQENESAPRKGRDTLMANEAKVLARAKSVASACVRPVFVSRRVLAGASRAAAGPCRTPSGGARWNRRRLASRGSWLCATVQSRR